jgi:hypothetical protein
MAAFAPRDCLAWLGLIGFGLVAAAAPALAYRPFDGTDAAVAAPGELEIEFQPAGPLWQGAERSLLAPVTVFNFGLREGWEAILQGQGQTPLSPSGPPSLTDAGVFLKHVLRPGVLQDQPGPSVVTEFGLLLPDSTGDSGLGASVAGIVSQRWEWGAIHFNAAAALTRDHYADVFVGSIFEGPAKWTVRPVAEIFYENEIGQAETVSGLVGLIWQARDNLAFDVGFRHAVTNGRAVNEVRAGVTVGFALWKPSASVHR